MLKDRVKKAMFRVMRPGLLELNQRLERLEAAIGAKTEPAPAGNGHFVFAQWRGNLQGRAIDAAGHEVPAMTAQYRAELESWWDSVQGRPFDSVYSAERQRHIRELGDFLGMPQSGDGFSADLMRWCAARSVVEVGAGPCPAIAMIPWRRAVAVDPLADGYTAEGLLPKDGDEVVYLSSMGESVPLPAAFADLVVLENSLEHVVEPARVLKECFRLLSAGGLLWLLVGLQELDEAKLREMVRSEGFEIVKDSVQTREGGSEASGRYRGLLRKIG